ncbi:Myb-like DNA-binding domain-containing protein [Spironucleus salmonicida]|uniref:Myb-like DNA-binding domain-containing protein n=1 Tax=Spironucleus salmonicida TaxID=348837 RepID=A0A9P8LPK8_9EUKA|nr:Myb-like DNA-binding domain-containing protein [Spironucleus salmonicida]
MTARTRWTHEQEEQLRQAYADYGGRWEVIRDNAFRGATVSQLKNKYYKLARAEPVVLKAAGGLANIALADIQLLARLLE